MRESASPRSQLSPWEPRSLPSVSEGGPAMLEATRQEHLEACLPCGKAYKCLLLLLPPLRDGGDKPV